MLRQTDTASVWRSAGHVTRRRNVPTELVISHKNMTSEEENAEEKGGGGVLGNGFI